MDTGKSFAEKHVSEAPVKAIQEAQKFVQSRQGQVRMVHLVGSNDKLLSVMIPFAFTAACAGGLAFGIKNLWYGGEGVKKEGF